MFLLLLLCILLAWFLSQKLYARYWCNGLSVEIEFQERFLYEGDTSAMKEIVVNDKFLPLPALEIRFSSNRDLEFLSEASANTSSTDRSYKRDVFSFLFHQRIERTLPFIAHKRGFYEIFDVSITGYDFFFRSGHYAETHQDTVLYVYPRQVDTYRIALLCQAVSGMLLSRSRLYPDPFEFSGIREYRREDPMNHINWKASARTGNLMVNQFDSTTSISLSILFDIEDRLILKYEELVEETIRIVSSLCGRLVKDRMSFHVAGNGLDPVTETPFSMYIKAGGGKIQELNQKLACIDIAQTVYSAIELLEKEAGLRRTDHTYIFISKNREDDLRGAMRALTGAGNQILWVLPIKAADASSLDFSPIPHVTMLPWEI